MNKNPFDTFVNQTKTLEQRPDGNLVNEDEGEDLAIVERELANEASHTESDPFEAVSTRLMEIKKRAKELQVPLPKDKLTEALRLYTMAEHTDENLQKFITICEELRECVDENVSAAKVAAETVMPQPIETKPVSQEPLDETIVRFKQLIDSPVTVEEVHDRESFMQQVFPWVVNGLMWAGYEKEEIDRILSLSIEKVNFKNEPTLIVADINRILQNLWKQILAEKNKPKEQTLTTNIEQAPVAGAVLNEPLILTSQMRVEGVEKMEPLVLTNPLPEKLVLTPEFKLGEYELALEALNAREFDPVAYADLAHTMHVDMVAKFDAINALAETNLKKFSPTYTPGKLEKQALQLLPNLKAQRIRSKNYAAELLNKLQQNELDVDEIKRLTHNYVVASENLVDNINKLQTLIEQVPDEEKPPLAEAYRAQFETLRVDGNKVLSALDKSHPRYNEFKNLLEDELATLISDISVEEGGDKALGERMSYFLSGRNRIKAAIGYLKQEHELHEVIARTQQKILTLSASVPTLPDNAPIEQLNTKAAVEKMIVELEQACQKQSFLPDGVEINQFSEGTLQEASSAVVKHENTIKELIKTTQEYLTEFDTIKEATETKLESTPNVVELPKKASEIVLRAQDRSAEFKKSTLREKVPVVLFNRILAKFRSRNLGMAAGAALAAMIPTGTDNSQPSFTTAPGFSVASVDSLPNTISGIDGMSIITYLQSLERYSPKSAVPAPSVPAYNISPQSAPTVEVVPGVTLGTTAQSLDYPTQSGANFGYSPLADTVPVDDGVSFSAPEADKKYVINNGDNFWDINEGQSIAGKLPVMSEINPYFKQALIDVMRDKINTDKTLRAKIGGMGDTADKIFAGEYMNITFLNQFARETAVDKGYLK